MKRKRYNVYTTYITFTRWRWHLFHFITELKFTISFFIYLWKGLLVQKTAAQGEMTVKEKVAYKCVGSVSVLDIQKFEHMIWFDLKKKQSERKTKKAQHRSAHKSRAQWARSASQRLAFLAGNQIKWCHFGANFSGCEALSNCQNYFRVFCNSFWSQMPLDIRMLPDLIFRALVPDNIYNITGGKFLP